MTDNKDWKQFEELDRLLEKPHDLLTPFDRWWFMKLFNLDLKLRHGDGEDDGYAQLMQVCENAVDDFLRGRSADELSGKDIDRYNNLNAMLRQALKEERLREEAKLKGLRSEYTSLIPETIH